MICKNYSWTRNKTKPSIFPSALPALLWRKSATFCPFARLRRAVPPRFQREKFQFAVRFYPLLEPFLKSRQRIKQRCGQSPRYLSRAPLRDARNRFHRAIASATAPATARPKPFPFNKRRRAREIQKFYFCISEPRSLYKTKCFYFLFGSSPDPSAERRKER